ncbi:MAG: hypothetical protein NZ853_02790 [Leptospiraceae bacterium]|nr:hypothetical protein [Leptospiraceae bacterium]MDW7975104.1 hypothetical protein [Leptospiraceae bacterium]
MKKPEPKRKENQTSRRTPPKTRRKKTQSRRRTPIAWRCCAFDKIHPALGFYLCQDPSKGERGEWIFEDELYFLEKTNSQSDGNFWDFLVDEGFGLIVMDTT